MNARNATPNLNLREQGLAGQGQNDINFVSARSQDQGVVGGNQRLVEGGHNAAAPPPPVPIPGMSPGPTQDLNRFFEDRGEDIFDADADPSAYTTPAPKGGLGGGSKNSFGKGYANINANAADRPRANTVLSSASAEQQQVNIKKPRKIIGPEKFYYDKRTFTGVHKHGGPVHVDAPDRVGVPNLGTSELSTDRFGGRSLF